MAYPRVQDEFLHLLPAVPSRLASQLPTRNYALDNLRTFLVALVIFHHTAIVYGGAGEWKVRSQCFPPESIPLITFNAIDQTFFMALFFFMSGHFTRLSMSRKKTNRTEVIRSRLLRILLPAIVYTILLEPTLDVIVRLWEGGAANGALRNVWPVYLSYWTNVRGIRGPVWYLALVMIFDSVAVLTLWNVEIPNQGYWKTSISQSKRCWAPLAWAFTVSSDFVIRLIYPAGKVWPVLNLQVAFLPQYVLAYLAGHLSVISDDMFVLIPSQYNLRNSGRKLFRSIMFSLSALGLLTLLEQKIMGIEIDQVMQLMRGGINIPAATYAAWNEMAFAVIGFALVAVFLCHGDYPWRLRKVWLPRYSYGAFLLHPLVSLGIELGIESLMNCRKDSDTSNHGIWSLAGPVLLTLIVGAVNVIASWTAAWCFLSLIPVVGKVI